MKIRKPKKQYKISMEKLSAINRENCRRSVEVRRAKKLAAIEAGRKPKVIAYSKTKIYSEDYVTLKRYARQEKRVLLEILHELINPLKKKIRNLPQVDPNDPWLRTVTYQEEY